MRRYLWTSLCGLGILSSVAGAAPVAISNGPQLFLDDYLIARMDNLERSLQQPTKHPSNPLVVQHFPWERRTISVYGTVLYEPDLGKFRMWYLGSADPDAVPEYYMCYAESEDGVGWTKPLVTRAEMPPYEEHNVVVPGGHGMCVMRKPDEPDPQKRYRGLGGDIIAYSPDGLDWTMQPFRSAKKNDTSSCVVWWKGEYMAYMRNQARDPDWPGVMRAVAVCVSRDFEDWTPKQTIFMTDETDGYPWTQVYGMAVTPYGDQLIGLPWFIYLDHENGNSSRGDIDVQMMVSRDGRHWRRVANRAVFLAPTEGTWDAGRVFPSTTMFVKDDQVYIYYTGDCTRHGTKAGKPGIGLATLPADRFMALRPADPSKDGVLATVPLRFSGTELLLNADVNAGDLLIEILDQQGRVVQGYDRDRCRLVRHDRLRFRVSWAGEEGERALGDVARGRPVALRFVIRRGALYAFQVVD